MGIKRILVPLLGSPNDEMALFNGILLAKETGSHLEVCFVRPDPVDTIPYLGFDGGSRDEIREDFKRYAAEMGKKAATRERRRFRAACKKNGIEMINQPGPQIGISASWSEVVGRATHEVPEAAKNCDLTFFAGSFTHFHRLVPNVLERTLLESGRPLLFARDRLVSLPPERIAVAWDASAQAVRAVAAAAPFLQDAKDIRVLSVEEAYEDTADPQRLVDYLAWHGLKAQGQIIKRSEDEVGRALLTVAQEFQASLLVMGGYAHSRFQEIVLGGTTLHVIRNAHLPLLLMH